MNRALALLVAGAFFMEILDATVIAPAAPYIAADLGVEPVDVTIAVTAYVLTVAVLVPVSGWLADRFGPRPVFTTALVLFTLASVGCALAPSLPLLTAARVVQGVGGAMMVPVGRLVVLRTTERTDLVRAIAYLTWPALLAPVLAPALGGFLAEFASWRWIFLINVPLGVAALVVAWFVVPRLRASSDAGSPPPLDRVGVALTAIGIGALVAGLEVAGHGNGAVAGALVAGAAVVLALAVRHLLRTERPLVDLRVLAVPTLRVTAGAGSVYRGVITAIAFLVPLYLQLGLGWSATQAGLLVLALFLGNVGIKPATTPLMRRFGIRAVLLGSIAVGMVCLGGFTLFGEDTPVAAIAAVLLVSGIARSTGFTAYNSVAFADVPPERMTPANTVVSTFSELATGLGVAAGALLVRFGELVGAGSDGAAGPFRVAFWLLAAFLLVPVAVALRMPGDAGDAVTGHGTPRPQPPLS